MKAQTNVFRRYCTPPVKKKVQELYKIKRKESP